MDEPKSIVVEFGRKGALYTASLSCGLDDVDLKELCHDACIGLRDRFKSLVKKCHVQGDVVAVHYTDISKAYFKSALREIFRVKGYAIVEPSMAA